MYAMTLEYPFVTSVSAVEASTRSLLFANLMPISSAICKKWDQFCHRLRATANLLHNLLVLVE